MKSKVQAMVRKYQAKSTDGTARKAFEQVDESPPIGIVSKREFKQAVKMMYKMVQSRDPFEDWMEEDAFQSLMDALADKKGNIPYDDFLLFALDVEEDDDLADLHGTLKKEVFKKAKLKKKEVEKMFASTKNVSNGYCRSSEFEKIFRKLHPKSSAKDVERIIERWDLANEGVVDFIMFSKWLDIGNNPDEVCCVCHLLALFISAFFLAFFWLFFFGPTDHAQVFPATVVDFSQDFGKCY